MKKDVFLISLGMAAGLGLSQVELGAARAAMEKTEHEVVELTLTPTALSTLENFLDTQACPFVNTKFSLSGADTCNLMGDLEYTFSGKIFNFLNPQTQEIERQGKVFVRVPVEGSFVVGAVPE